MLAQTDNPSLCMTKSNIGTIGILESYVYDCFACQNQSAPAIEVMRKYFDSTFVKLEYINCLGLRICHRILMMTCGLK